MDILPELLSQLARGGGGGSSGGSGGGGLLELIGLIGYLPSYYGGMVVKKWLPRKQELFVSLVAATTISVVLTMTAIHIHDDFGWLVIVFIIIGVWLGWAAAFFSAWEKIKARARKTNQQVAEAAHFDSAWNPEKLIEHARVIFMRYQEDWSNFNIDSIRTYATESYATHASLMLRALKELHRVNSMANVRINDALITDMRDSVDNQEDAFTVAFNAQALDVLRAENDISKTLYSDTSAFIEYWTFVRRSDTWLLDAIEQQTADASAADRELKSFAQSNGLYYSLDMGWLFLPASGVLFAGGSFGKSDINNHIIGLYGDNLIQLYTYIDDKEGGSSVTVAQINLPRSCGGISIRRKYSFWSLSPPQAPKPPSSYKRYTFEWPDFNKRYQVAATDQDRLATFELLNPGFMAYLYDKDPGVSIEVADNVVYLYTLTGGTDTKTYQVMLEILNKTHKELRL